MYLFDVLYVTAAVWFIAARKKLPRCKL